MDSQALALVITAIGVASFTVVFAILFINYRKFSVAEINSGKRDIDLIEQYFHDKEPAVVIRRKIFKVLKFIAYTAIMAVITVSLVFALFIRFSSNLPVGTKTLMVVASGSMSTKNEVNDYLFTNNLNDQFPTYAIIVLEVVDPSELKQYDVIAYNHPSGKTYIHRIRAIEYSTDGTRTYRTRGDAVASDDQNDSAYNVVVTDDDIVGRYTGVYVPYIGAFVQFMQSAAGIVTVIALVFCLIMFDRNAGKITEAHEKRTAFLFEALDIDNNVHEESEISVDFVEKIYFDKVAYSLESNGKVSSFVSDEVAAQVLKEHAADKKEENEADKKEENDGDGAAN